MNDLGIFASLSTQSEYLESESQYLILNHISNHSKRSTFSRGVFIILPICKLLMKCSTVNVGIIYEKTQKDIWRFICFMSSAMLNEPKTPSHYYIRVCFVPMIDNCFTSLLVMLCSSLTIRTWKYMQVDGTESLLQSMLHSRKWGTLAFVVLEILFWGLVAGFLNMKRFYIRL